MRGKFLDPLELEYVDGRKWRLTTTFDYRLGSPDGLEEVVVQAGFITDFASVPRALWIVLPPTGSYGKAAVAHDWLYQLRTIQRTNGWGWRYATRREADTILLEAMQVLGTSWFVRWTIYLGVRLGGWLTWNRYRKQEAR